MHSNGNINQFLVIYTGLVVLKCHCTEVYILHGHVNLMVQANATADFSVSIVLLKIIHVPCVHRCYIQNHPSFHFSVNNENLVQFCGLLIVSRFTYATRNKRLLYLLMA